jgi:hypothetical protein
MRLGWRRLARVRWLTRRRARVALVPVGRSCPMRRPRRRLGRVRLVRVRAGWRLPRRLQRWVCGRVRGLGMRVRSRYGLVRVGMLRWRRGRRSLRVMCRQPGWVGLMVLGLGVHRRRSPGRLPGRIGWRSGHRRMGPGFGGVSLLRDGHLRRWRRGRRVRLMPGPAPVRLRSRVGPLRVRSGRVPGEDRRLGRRGLRRPVTGRCLGALAGRIMRGRRVGPGLGGAGLLRERHLRRWRRVRLVPGPAPVRLRSRVGPLRVRSGRVQVEGLNRRRLRPRLME